MRKIYLFVLIALGFSMTSCRNTYYVTKKTTFDDAILSVQSQIENQGFRSIGFESTFPTLNYGTQSRPGHLNNYCFVDSLGNTMKYSISWRTRQLQLIAIELCDCNTSNPNDFERFCGEDGVVKQIMEGQRMDGYTRMNIYERSAFDSVVGSIQSQMGRQGFELIGYGVNGTTPNQPAKIDNYHFVDRFGNVIDFSVSYRMVESKKGTSINDVELCGCETSNPNDYKRFCGDEGVIRQTLENSNYCEAIRSVQSNLERNGFLTTSYETVMVEPHNFIQQDSYHFIDSLGNTMEYSVVYGKGKSKKGTAYVSGVEFCGCETSNPDDYIRLCGDDRIFGKIKELPKDLDISAEVNKEKLTFGLVAVLTLVASIVLSALLFPK